MLAATAALSVDQEVLAVLAVALHTGVEMVLGQPDKATTVAMG
jgi:hypothetical protein